VLDAVSATVQPGAGNAQFNYVINQATNDYGQSSVQYQTIIAAVGDRQFSNVRVSQGLQAGLDYLRPSVSAACSGTTGAMTTLPEDPD
jgi:hypothetical protein